MSGSGATPVQRVSVGPGTVGLSFVDVSSQPFAAQVFADDFAAGRDATRLGSIKFAVQEEKQLVAAALPSGDHIEDLLAASFSECKEDSSVDAWQVCGIDDTIEDKLSDALSEQFDKYLSQFDQNPQQPAFVGLDEELENFDNLFPGLGFD